MVFFGVIYIYIYFVGDEKNLKNLLKLGFATHDFLWVHSSVIVVYDDQLWDSVQLQFIINQQHCCIRNILICTWLLPYTFVPFTGIVTLDTCYNSSVWVWYCFWCQFTSIMHNHGITDRNHSPKLSTQTKNCGSKTDYGPNFCVLYVKKM